LHNPDNDNQPRFLASEIVIFDKIFRHCLFALGGRTPLLPFFRQGSVRPPKITIFDNTGIFLCQFDFGNKNRAIKKHTPAYF
jgi:hypothetical protein